MRESEIAELLQLMRRLTVATERLAECVLVFEGALTMLGDPATEPAKPLSQMTDQEIVRSMSRAGSEDG